MRLHARQFFIGPRTLAVDETWRSLAIGDGLHLSHQVNLPVAEVRDRDGAAWYLIGLALQSDPDRPSPVEEIAGARTEEVDALTAAWSGRWVLLGEQVLRADACLYACYYGRDPESGALLVSSSPALLQLELGVESAAPPLAWRVGMEWYPPPASRFKEIRRLLPSQVLRYAGDEPAVLPRRLVRRPFSGTYDETLAFVETSLRTVLRRLTEVRGRVVLAVTGGYDSRLLLAAASREGLELPTFTWEIPGQSDADRLLPPVLARDAGLPHRTLRRRTFNEDHLRLLEAHTALHNADLDRELVPWGQYDELGHGATIVLGNLFVVGAEYFHGKLDPRLDRAVESIEEAYHFAAHHPGSTPHNEGIREWVDWITAHPEPGMDWRDRFLWEQWMGGWCAAAEQGTDVVEVECISPANCEAILGAILNVEPAKRPNKRWQVELTYRMAPALADHPYQLGGGVVDRLRREVAAGRSHPSKRRFVAGRARSLRERSRSAGAGSEAAAFSNPSKL